MLGGGALLRDGVQGGGRDKNDDKGRSVLHLYMITTTSSALSLV